MCADAVSMDCDLVVIGAGPAGSAAAAVAARAGAKVVVVEKGVRGRDKVCGDGLTPRAISALERLGVDSSAAHRIDGLRMVTSWTTRELSWPASGRFADHGAVWPRRRFDERMVALAEESGAELRFSTEGLPVVEDGRAVGVRTVHEVIRAPLVLLASGAQGAAAQVLGATRDPAEPFGLAIRAYAPSPRHAERHLEACLSLRDEQGRAIPGYGWLFPAGDGTVNVGVGALSSMRSFRELNLNRLLDQYAAQVRDGWGLGGFVERPRAWRIPMSVVRRYGPGWAALGDAAGLVNPMNGEGIDYALESGIVAAECFLADPVTAPVCYDRVLAEQFDPFLRTGRRFSFLIGHPWILQAGLRVALGSRAAAEVTLSVMGNLVDPAAPGVSGRVLAVADRVLGWADPLLHRTRARE